MRNRSLLVITLVCSVSVSELPSQDTGAGTEAMRKAWEDTLEATPIEAQLRSLDDLVHGCRSGPDKGWLLGRLREAGGAGTLRTSKWLAHSIVSLVKVVTLLPNVDRDIRVTPPTIQRLELVLLLLKAGADPEAYGVGNSPFPTRNEDGSLTLEIDVAGIGYPQPEVVQLLSTG